MRRIVAIGLGAALLAGCQTNTYTADMSFAKAPGLGYWNSGLLPAGRLYLWDTRSNKLTIITDSVEFVQEPSREPPTNLSSTNVQGIAVEGSFGSNAIKTAVSAEVGRQVEFNAQGAVRERYGSIYTALSNAYIKDASSGDVDTHWSVADATRPKSGLYYVLISGVVRANDTSLSHKGLKDNNVASVTVTVPGLGKPLSVNVINGAKIGCSGVGSACFFEATVLKPYINANRRLDFKPARDVNLKPLSDALRDL